MARQITLPRKKRNIVGDVQSPKSKGKYIGCITRVDKKSFVVDTDAKIANGDGLCFFNKHGALVGIRINRGDGNVLFPKDDVSRLGLRMGMEVYRNSDISFTKELSRSERCRTIAVDLTLSEVEGVLSLTIRDTDGLESTIMLPAVGEEAKNPEVVRAVAEKQLKKCGGTIFSVKSVQVTLRSNLFYPAAIFNEIRRKGFLRHGEVRGESFKSKPSAPRVDRGKWPAADVTYLDNICNTKALEFYKKHGVVEANSAFEKADKVVDAALMTTKYCIKAQLGSCPKMKGSTKNMEGSLLLSDNTGEYCLSFDCRKCEMQLRLKKD